MENHAGGETLQMLSVYKAIYGILSCHLHRHFKIHMSIYTVRNRLPALSVKSRLPCQVPCREI
jgi:hypothetical protein